MAGAFTFIWLLTIKRLSCGYSKSQFSSWFLLFACFVMPIQTSNLSVCQQPSRCQNILCAHKSQLEKKKQTALHTSFLGNLIQNIPGGLFSNDKYFLASVIVTLTVLQCMIDWIFQSEATLKIVTPYQKLSCCICVEECNTGLMNLKDKLF